VQKRKVDDYVFETEYVTEVNEVGSPGSRLLVAALEVGVPSGDLNFFVANG